jgi:cyclopropane-fatty-acyl-phospholipid synthase
MTSDPRLASLSAFPARPSTVAYRRLQDLLARADVILDGPRPVDIRINDPRACRAILGGSLGFGESYMAGWWDCDALDELAFRLFYARLDADPWSLRLLPQVAAALALNLQSRARSRQVAEAHYDVGNDLFERMLDRDLVYTCGYWADAESLEEAQAAKLELSCRKLGLRPGMRVLDIGCGFGAFMKYASERYGVSCVGYSVSERQTEVARRRCDGLPVEVVLDDYRSITGKYDRVVSIGMLEAVGYKNYRAFARVVHDALADDGIALIHTVGHNVSTRRGDPWIDRYVFPNGMLPSLAQLATAFEGLFVIEDLHNFGPHYDRTLRVWNARFQAAWPELSRRYERRFKRMWELYLLGFAGGFRARNWQLWQIVLTKPGRPQPLCRFT